MTQRQPLHIPNVSIGADPEVFIRDGEGKIVPSALVVPKRGITDPNHFGTIVQDGVQVEFTYPVTHCRNSMKTFIAYTFNTLLNSLPAGYTIDMSSNIVIPPKEFKALDVDARRLGCALSQNIYKPSPIKVNPETYRRRSAGGHVHLGSLPHRTTESSLKAEFKEPTEFAVRLVKTLDMALGNTSVLFDRDPLAATRRRVYGRAGEYRIPGLYRLEYRTLSNFWLRSRWLHSMVFGIARQAVGVAENPKLFKELSGRTNWNAVRRAINTNNYDLAFENWSIYRKFLTEYVDINNFYITGLNDQNIVAFDRLISWVKQYGLERFVPANVPKYWSSLALGGYRERYTPILLKDYGFESFLTNLPQDVDQFPKGE